jgi:4-hydroxy-tetrahydrodipicolinate reductase
MDVLIDFTTPECGLAALYHGGKNNVGHVIGTTGFSAAQQNILADYSKNVPIVFSSNMSICVNLLLALVEKVAASLDNSYDIEISEMHHRDKLDAPSGTAIAIGKAAAIGRDVQFHEVAILSGHYGMGIKRPEGRIGFSSQRGGKVIGSHSVSFMGDSDVLTMSHSAMDRSIYSKGALLAAAWLRGKPPGLYSMRDVLSNVKELF